MIRLLTIMTTSLLLLGIVGIILAMAWGPVLFQGEVSFTGWNGQYDDLYLVDFRTRVTAPLSLPDDFTALHRIFQHAWAPDGERMIVLSNLWMVLKSQQQPDLTVLIGMERMGNQVAWSPVADKVAYDSVTDRALRPVNYDVNVLDLQTGETVNISQHPAEDYFPVWSPDGEWLAFVSTREIFDEYTTQDTASSIYIVRPDGQDLRRVSSSNGWDTLPAWSPDGRMLVYQSSNGGLRWLTVLDITTGQEQMFAKTLDRIDTPVWSPDGQAIAFIGWKYNDIAVYTVTLDGTVTRLTGGKSQHFDPVWSADGRWVIYRKQPGRVLERVSIYGGSPQRISPTHLQINDFQWRP